MPIPLIAVMLRFGKKYDMEHFLEEAIARLQYEFPRNLSDWDSISKDSYSRIVQNGDPVPLDIIILAQEAGLQSILPLAYYLFFDDEDPVVHDLAMDRLHAYLLTHNRNKYIQHTRLNTEPRPLPRRMYKKFYFLEGRNCLEASCATPMDGWRMTSIYHMPLARNSPFALQHD